MQRIEAKIVEVEKKHSEDCLRADEEYQAEIVRAEEVRKNKIMESENYAVDSILGKFF